MIKRIALINRSSVVDSAAVTKMAAACNFQITRDVAPAWGKAPIPVVFYANENSIPSGSARIYIFDNSDQEYALGYHTVSGTTPWGKVFAKTITDYGLPVLYNPRDRGAITVSSVVSHEVIELVVDPYVDLWADGPLVTEGSQYAFEACDPVEADLYQITVSSKVGPVSVSNFVYPEYFNQDSPAGTRLDYLGLLSQPYTLTQNGYMIIRNSAGVESAIFGQKYPEILKLIKS